MLRPAVLNRLGRNGSKPPESKQATGVTFVGPDSARIVLLPSGSQPDAEQLTKAIALATSTYAFTATRYRWENISEPPLGVVRDMPDGQVEAVPGHELAGLLDEPSPDYDMGFLMAVTEAHMLNTGAALWVKDRAGEDGTGPVVRFTPYSGDQFDTFAADGRIYGRFRVRLASGPKDFYPEDVVFFRETNPLSWRDWLPRLEVALAQLDLGHQVNRTIRNYMRQGMFPGVSLSPDKDWNPAPNEFEAYKNQIAAWHSGPGNAGAPLVLMGGTQVQALALRLRDLLPTEALDRIETNIGSVYGIAPVILGWKVGLENSPWSQMSEARRMTYEDTLEPRWHDYEKGLTRQLLSPLERAAGYRITFDMENITAMRDDDSDRATIAVQMADVWTLNERRTYTGKEPLEDERGDEIGGGGAGMASVMTLSQGEGMAPARARLPAAFTKAGDSPRNTAWFLFDLNTKAAERTWEREVAKALKAQRDEVLALARKHLEEEAKAAKPSSVDILLTNLEQWLEEEAKLGLYRAVHPLVFSTAESAVKQVAGKLSLSFSLLEEGLGSYADRETAFLVDKMGKTTGQALVKAVQKSLDAGETVQALTKRLTDLPAFDRTRARLAARTETTRAWNGSQRETLSGYQADTRTQIEKSWLSSRDDAVREEHDAWDDGEWYPIDYAWDGGVTEPSEPNCRCTLIYRVMEPGAEE